MQSVVLALLRSRTSDPNAMCVRSQLLLQQPRHDTASESSTSLLYTSVCNLVDGTHLCLASMPAPSSALQQLL
jgi:hypothetical protein